MKAIFRGIFEKVEDRAHNRTRLVAKQVCTTRALPGQEFIIGHVERSLFRAREPQQEVDYFGIEKEAMQFARFLLGHDDYIIRDLLKDRPDWLDFRRTRVYCPVVEVIEEPASDDLLTSAWLDGIGGKVPPG